MRFARGEVLLQASRVIAPAAQSALWGRAERRPHLCRGHGGAFGRGDSRLLRTGQTGKPRRSDGGATNGLNTEALENFQFFNV